MRGWSERRLRRFSAAVAATMVVLGLTAVPAGASACTLEVSDAWLIEEDAGTVGLTFEITSPCGSQAGSVEYTTSPGSALAASDFVATSGSIDLSTDKPWTFDVPIVGDTTREWTELFTVHITSETWVTNDDSGVGRVIDDDGMTKVVVFDNESFVDSSDDSGAESTNMQIALAALGHDVSTTEAFDAAGLAAALEGADTFVIPEQENEGNLATSMDDAAKQVVVDFVEAGGRLVVAADDRGLLDALFGYELSQPGNSPSTLDAEVAAGTRWETETPTLGSNDATMSWEIASLPEGALALYVTSQPNGNQLEAVEASHATVFSVTEGEGEVVSLGYDWYDSHPGSEGVDPEDGFDEPRTPQYSNPDGQENGWTSVLDTAVEVVPPAPTGTGVVGGNKGYFSFGSDGSVYAYGGAGFVGTLAQKTPTGKVLNSAIVDGAVTKTNGGYWMVGGDGGVFNKGDAAFYGSMGGKPLNKPIVGMARTVGGMGYWLVASDGGVFSFGDASFHGSMASQTLNKPIVGIQPSPTGSGYWLVASDGGIFAFGDAPPKGSTGSLKLNAAIVDMVSTPTGQGYWLASADGGIFAFGDALFYGSMGAKKLTKPIVRMDGTGTGQGYRLVGLDGGVFSFGDAAFFGSEGNKVLLNNVVGLAAID